MPTDFINDSKRISRLRRKKYSIMIDDEERRMIDVLRDNGVPLPRLVRAFIVKLYREGHYDEL